MLNVSKQAQAIATKDTAYKAAETAAQKAYAAAKVEGASFVTLQANSEQSWADKLRSIFGKSEAVITGFRDGAEEQYAKRLEILKRGFDARVKLVAGEAVENAPQSGSARSIYNRRDEMRTAVKAALALGEEGAKEMGDLLTQGSWLVLVESCRNINTMIEHGTLDAKEIKKELAAKREERNKDKTGARAPKDWRKRIGKQFSAMQLSQLVVARAMIDKVIAARQSEESKADKKATNAQKDVAARNIARKVLVQRKGHARVIASERKTLRAA